MSRDEQAALLAMAFFGLTTGHTESAVRTAVRRLAETGHCVLVVSMHDERETVRLLFEAVELLGGDND